MNHVLFDGNNLLYRVYYSYVVNRDPPFTNKNGYPTGMIFGILELATSWLKKIPRFEKISFFFDGRPSRRLALDSNYKSSRTQKLELSGQEIEFKDEKFSGDFEILIRLLNLFGVDVYWGPDEEADDLIASFVRQNDLLCTIVSSDKDYYQLVNNKTVLYRPGIPNPFYDEERIYEDGYKEVKITPEQVRLYKSLVGDSSDNLPGVMRLRKIIASKLSMNLNPNDMFNADLSICSEREKNLILESKERIKLNYDMIGFYDKLDLTKYKIEGNRDIEAAEKIVRDGLDINSIDLSIFKPAKGRFITSDALEMI